jgi:hypothetical protein
VDHVTDESLDKIKNILNNKQYIASKGFEEKVINEMLDILRNDDKFQDFSKQCMTDIILGK